jgi:hypothetical protein
MCSCWHEIPAKRPTFRELKMKLEILMDEMAKNTGNEEGKKLEMNENGYLKVS